MVSLEEYKDPDLKVKAFEDSVGFSSRWVKYFLTRKQLLTLKNNIFYFHYTIIVQWTTILEALLWIALLHQFQEGEFYC